MPVPRWVLRLAQAVRRPGGAPTLGRRGGGQREPAPAAHRPAARVPYPGDFHGRPDLPYSPHPDGEPDPGEIVWAWVPYEENHARGKDRPVLIVGRDDEWLLGLPLTSRDHDRDARQEHASGRDWVDIGSGAWDRLRRPSEVRVNRIVRLDPGSVRREGAVLAEDRFAEVVAAVRRTR